MQLTLTSRRTWKNIAQKIPVITKKNTRKKKYQTMTLKRQGKS